MNYQGNSKSQKSDKVALPKKEVAKVITTTVVVKKKSLGQKIKSLFVEADIRSVVRYVTSDVLIPAARNMIVDSATKGVERMMYGESSLGRRRPYGQPTRYSYNNPINRAPDPRSPMGRVPPSGPRSRQQDNFILETREEADLVLERLNDIIDTYEVASVADLNELVGVATSHVDNKWGWVYLGDVQVRQIREGFIIDLPPAEPINQ